MFSVFHKGDTHEGYINFFLHSFFQNCVSGELILEHRNKTVSFVAFSQNLTVTLTIEMAFVIGMQYTIRQL